MNEQATHDTIIAMIPGACGARLDNGRWIVTTDGKHWFAASEYFEIASIPSDHEGHA